MELLIDFFTPFIMMGGMIGIIFLMIKLFDKIFDEL